MKERLLKAIIPIIAENHIRFNIESMKDALFVGLGFKERTEEWDISEKSIMLSRFETQDGHGNTTGYHTTITVERTKLSKKQEAITKEKTDFTDDEEAFEAFMKTVKASLAGIKYKAG